MEFYCARHSTYRRTSRVSIPNGMEFYFRLFDFAARWCCVSIPNGMEFYVFKTALLYSSNSFQFPTGWNSTYKNSINALLRKHVSIPNGMEFYNNTPEKMGGGFNSQRDGILPDYKNTVNEILARFNSQRDGILLNRL